MKNSKFVIDKLSKLFEQGLVSSKDLGNELMKRIIDDTSKMGKVEISPKFEGRQIIMIIQPL